MSSSNANNVRNLYEQIQWVENMAEESLTEKIKSKVCYDNWASVLKSLRLFKYEQFRIGNMLEMLKLRPELTLDCKDACDILSHLKHGGGLPACIEQHDQRSKTDGLEATEKTYTAAQMQHAYEMGFAEALRAVSAAAQGLKPDPDVMSRK